MKKRCASHSEEKEVGPMGELPWQIVRMARERGSASVGRSRWSRTRDSGRGLERRTSWDWL